MTDPQPIAPVTTTPSEPPPAWKPEPRQWSWKDLFTAPMLAFKPKCMLVSAATIIALGLWWLLFLMPLSERSNSIADNLATSMDTRAWYYIVLWFWTAVSAAIFGLGASLVGVFLKADLLDDEFLSFGEAIAQFKTRLLPAVAVPLFLLVLVTGVWGAIWFGQLVCSVPYAGPAFYVLTYPLAFAFALFAVLLAAAAVLSLFIFPGIIAVRRHGWFDNVVDTIEAVGTKPHLLVASLALTAALVWVAWSAGTAAMGGMNQLSASLPGTPVGGIKDRFHNQLAATENAAEVYRTRWLAWFTNDRRATSTFDFIIREDQVRLDNSAGAGFVRATGYGVAFWQTVITALIAGYCLNLALAGGLLTYLWVREDDYWDEEDLQDLDQLAKELEEEAKAEEAAERAKTGSTLVPDAQAPVAPTPPVQA
jgi:hypothetical protein